MSTNTNATEPLPRSPPPPPPPPPLLLQAMLKVRMSKNFAMKKRKQREDEMMAKVEGGSIVDAARDPKCDRNLSGLLYT